MFVEPGNDPIPVVLNVWRAPISFPVTFAFVFHKHNLLAEASEAHEDSFSLGNRHGLVQVSVNYEERRFHPIEIKKWRVFDIGFSLLPWMAGHSPLSPLDPPDTETLARLVHGGVLGKQIYRAGAVHGRLENLRLYDQGESRVTTVAVPHDSESLWIRDSHLHNPGHARQDSLGELLHRSPRRQRGIWKENRIAPCRQDLQVFRSDTAKSEAIH